MSKANPHFRTVVVERLFNQKVASDGTLPDPIVTLDEVELELRRYADEHPDESVGVKNFANFFKDFVRNINSANQWWPSSVLNAGFTGRQRTGSGASFEFVCIASGHPAFCHTAAPNEHTPRQRIESASLPYESRQLGRVSEPWLMQVMVRLRVVETHLTLFSKRSVVQVDHLQMDLKLAKSQIDALYLALEESGNYAVVSCEAKGERDDILEDQILNQVRDVFRIPGMKHDLVIPLAIKTIGPSEVYIAEFSAVRKCDCEELESLTVASDAIYELVPPVPGIGKHRRPRSSK
jgi:hypothetical protein